MLYTYYLASKLDITTLFLDRLQEQCVKNVFTLLHFKPTVASKRVTDKFRALTQLWPCQNV